jgi:NhaA family Na+:H+ antiporter
MSIFISLLAFEDAEIINNAKFMILVASTLSGIIGFLWLKKTCK